MEQFKKFSKKTKLTKKEKEIRYKAAQNDLAAILQNENEVILKMSTINCILRTYLPYYFWTGFYLVNNGELTIGPYQGTLGCLHIAFGKGVCGTAAKTKQTQVVKDVDKFPGHIACDSQSKSEIVIPIFDNKNNLIGVFDVDSTKLNSFDEIDKTYLENILSQHFSS